MGIDPEFRAILKNGGLFPNSSNLEITDITTSTISGYADLDSSHHQPWGVVHGGLYATIIESMASVGAAFYARDLGKNVVGVNNNTNFLRPFLEGRVLVEGRAIQQGRTQQLWEVVITAEETGKEISRGQVRLQNIDPR